MLYIYIRTRVVTSAGKGVCVRTRGDLTLMFLMAGFGCRRKFEVARACESDALMRGFGSLLFFLSSLLLFRRRGLFPCICKHCIYYETRSFAAAYSSAL